ncbi:type VII secretion target [Kibdelosporangium persicum]|uniref:Excreted virulence factor EspC, type VII ESX diderm n=1 Tax=Kibdelosporangium persicum TaxID=2698649 RepID=A0ABX2F1C7_9PSEU|nr:type VII secretion target [Kibdelosporangium persicum]NRN65134.1 Excreted virulence factor EspC, type VII ESX diderm [Kibdelosporangium persicum]
MPDGYNVNVAQLRAHADHVDAIRERFAAVKGASGHIAQDDQAYGLLCGWISGILEGRHTRQDELIAQVENNLLLVAKALRDSAQQYESRESGNVSLLNSADGGGAR